ncbi:MAG: restriction endonuclease subunit S [Chitinophagales bacterium]|nr:restriction endonuclease subunit S [Chitinophagales bacterium]
MSWEKTSLRDLVLNLTSGGRPKGGSIDRGIFSIGAEHLDGNGGFDLSNGKYIPLDYYNSIGKGKIKANDILLVKDGATTGKASFVSSDFPLADAAINEHVFRIELKEDLIYPKYCFYFLVSTEGQKNIMSDFRGATVGGISKSILDKIQIPLPPLATQKRIAEILDSADALMRKDQELLKKYDELAQVIFINMFGDPVKNDKGWEVKTIKSTTNILTYGLTVRPKYIDKGFPLISARELRKGFVNFEDAPKISHADFSKLSDKCKPQKGDILFSKTGSIGLSAIVDSSQEFAVTQNAARINFKNEFYETYFIYALLRQESFINKCVSLVKGNAVKDLQLGDFSEIEIICPPISKQIKFSEISRKTNELIKNSKDNSIVSDHLFNSLIQKAFNGELVS